MLPDRLEAVCFDIGGTLVRTARGSLAEEFAGLLGVEIGRPRRLLVEHGKRRPVTSGYLAGILAEGCGRPDLTGEIRQRLDIRAQDLSCPEVYDDAIETLDTLRSLGWRIFFLSNAVGLRQYQEVAPAYFSRAESVLHSWQIGFCKPEAGAFRAVEAIAGLPPGAMVQVGNSWTADVEGALAAGWSAVHLSRVPTPRTRDDRVPAITDLRELVGLLPIRRGPGSFRGGVP